MKTKIALTAAILAAPAMALAQADTMDTDGDGVISFDEMVVAYPDLTDEVFAVIDADADGAVTEEEMQAAVDAGIVVLPETDS